ncbi:uncharacterized protein J8A68_001988 [[Candida] subhashii]|uniref:[RNA-polymerase]-subunit kinase n=1 Tax=[Candida] subhashii TaxID=561895 RepID=A0A8J5QJZ8_9ASCO|nr:uncharacterized protein J8A68_001988 [[Candida] subhashii]KAG7664482.1 hypothetical protein J8A68_001988 [[Candida] subhashii]
MSIPALPFKVKTIVSWAGEEEGDLGFIENEVVEVYSIVDESWWSGKLRRNNAEGIFPRDYVEIIEDRLNHSSSNNSLNNSRFNTPTKQQPLQDDPRMRRSNGSTPQTLLNKLTPSKPPPNPLNNPNMSFEYEADGSFDNSFKATGYTPTKATRSKKCMSSIINHPRNKMAYQQQQEEMLRDVEVDDGSFTQTPRLIQSDSKRFSQHEKYYSSPDVRIKNSRSQSFVPRENNSQQHYPKSQSYADLTTPRNGTQISSPPYQQGAEPYGSRQHSPNGGYRSGQIPQEDDILNDFEEISRKRAQLEYELQKLKQLERSSIMKKSPIAKHLHDNNPSIDSYSSNEDSKKPYPSRDDLSKKLSRSVTDEDYEDDEYDDNRQYIRSNHGSASPEREESPPPPPPPKHATPIRKNYETENQLFQKASFNGSGSQIDVTEKDLQRLALQHEELKASIKSLQSDVLNLSELSATSAGSFMRHKYEKQLRQSELGMNGMSLEEKEAEENEQNDGPSPQEPEFRIPTGTKETMDHVFQDKKSRHPNIFKKLLKKSNSDDIALNHPIEQRFKKQEEIDMTAFKMDIDRMNSLTTSDKQGRTRRVVREEGSLIVKPLDFISEINTNETVIEDAEVRTGVAGQFTLDEMQYSKVEKFMESYSINSDLNDMISDISTKFHTSKLNQIRCILLHFCKFRIIEESSKISTIKPKLTEVQYKGEASIYQLNYLFKKILDALRIPSEVVLGFWKKPNEFYHNEQYVINHCWLSILIDGNFRILDIYNFKHVSVCNLRSKFNEFYFLSEPLSLVSTHIPSIIDLQHVMPPIDPNIAFYLPRTYSGFYKNNLSIRNFNNALTRLKDWEFFELELDIPQDVELFTLVKTAKITTNDLSLCQIKWTKHKRIAKIKAILPERESIGVLQIFAGPKGLQKHFENIHELSVVIPLYHQGIHKPTKFVQRFPTVQSQRNDLYIIKPQTNKIIVKTSYNFEIEQYPSQGLDELMVTNEEFKLVIESPSGKYFKLNKENTDLDKPYGVYSSNIKCSETGLYRGLVIGDSGTSCKICRDRKLLQISSNYSFPSAIMSTAAVATRRPESNKARESPATTQNYSKEKKVGEGTYAVVYLGHQITTKRRIAIKEIKTGIFKDGLDMSALREVKYLQELRHPNVIELIDVFSTTNNLNLVLEFLPCDLEVLIKDKSIVFKSSDIKSWLLMTLRGIHHCHRNFILHRDLKPNNLLIAPDGQLKIADFGLARSLGNASEDLSSNVVTRWYRAPELLFGAKHYTGAIDIWSIGIIFAELMLRIPYLPGKDDIDQLDVTFRALGTPTEQIWPHVSSLPLYNSLKLYPPPSKQELRNRFSAATEKALDLLICMTQLDPSRRCDSTQALLHDYFIESPRATDPKNLPGKGDDKKRAGEDGIDGDSKRRHM